MTDSFDRAKSLFLAGLAHFEAGRFGAAAGSFEASLEVLPGRVSTLLNLAAARLQSGEPRAALEATQAVLAAEPGNAEAWFHRGAALADLGDLAEALASFDEAVTSDTHHAAIWFRRGQVLQALDRHAEALESHDRALAIEPTHGRAWSQRGGSLREMGRLDEAARSFEQAIAQGDDPALNGYYLAAVGAGDAPASPPAEYVTTLFDDYAGQFDEHLMGVLGYRGPQALFAQLSALGRERFESVLDLGCGTGLCGPLARPRTARLAGVDLSAGMLEKARALGVYDELAQAHIVEHLNSTERRHDLLLAADVFIYIGDLAPVFAGARRVLAPGGAFSFSAEIGDSSEGNGGSENGFELLPTLRYAHSEQYLRGLAAAHGFVVEAFGRQAIRDDQGTPVDAWFACLVHA